MYHYIIVFIFHKKISFDRCPVMKTSLMTIKKVVSKTIQGEEVRVTTNRDG
jgi:hypothetical protein